MLWPWDILSKIKFLSHPQRTMQTQAHIVPAMNHRASELSKKTNKLISMHLSTCLWSTSFSFNLFSFLFFQLFNLLDLTRVNKSPMEQWQPRDNKNQSARFQICLSWQHTGDRKKNNDWLTPLIFLVLRLLTGLDGSMKTKCTRKQS